MILVDIWNAVDSLKGGALSGALFGMLTGVATQHVPWSLLLYSFQTGQLQYQFQRDRITYTFVEVPTIPPQLGEGELLLMPIIGWIIAASLLGIIVGNIYASHRASVNAKRKVTSSESGPGLRPADPGSSS